MITERCRSGRTGRSRKPLYARAYRGFESLPLRHIISMQSPDCIEMIRRSGGLDSNPSVRPIRQERIGTAAGRPGRANYRDVVCNPSRLFNGGSVFDMLRLSTGQSVMPHPSRARTVHVAPVRTGKSDALDDVSNQYPIIISPYGLPVCSD